ncbi:hypothetical protein KM043_008588 [Ampulex compressa]|nr:hypothetical protein KM043_008588 [Ampulex compressa]
MDVRMRIRRQGGVRGPSGGPGPAHYQQLWPNGTPRRRTRLHRPPPTPATASPLSTADRELAPACRTTTEFNCSINHYSPDPTRSPPISSRGLLSPPSLSGPGPLKISPGSAHGCCSGLTSGKPLCLTSRGLDECNFNPYILSFDIEALRLAQEYEAVSNEGVRISARDVWKVAI